MSMQIPVRLGPAELALIEQLTASGATELAERLAVTGLPTRKVEAYHYTDLKMLWRQVPPAAVTADEAGEPPLSLPDAFRVELVNGAIRTPASPPEGVHLHIVDGSPLTVRDDILVRLNIGLVGETLALEVSGSLSAPIYIDRRMLGPAGHAASAARIFVSDGATVTIVETYSGQRSSSCWQPRDLSVGRKRRQRHTRDA